MSEPKGMNDETQPPAFREHFYARSPRSVPAAREFARRALVDWGVESERAHEVEICVSELATNALLHGVPPGRGFRLALHLLPSAGGPVTAGGLHVELHDSGDGVPLLAPTAASAKLDPSGRGLVLVDALSDKWGVGEREVGKVVWCEFFW